MGNEGKLVVFVPSEQKERAVQIISESKYGERAKIIGTVSASNGVFMETHIGGKRRVNLLIGQGLPRIC